MNDQIERLWEEQRRNPDGLTFLRLAEVLRRSGDLRRAKQVAAAGVERHPGLADAHDLYAKVLGDLGENMQARAEWLQALGLNHDHVGAHKGLAFLFFREGNLERSLTHLDWAAKLEPTDGSLGRARETVRKAIERQREEKRITRRDTVFGGLEGAEESIMLVDAQGLVLGGGAQDRGGRDVSVEVAAYVAGLAQEAERTARFLNLGAWERVLAECPEGHVQISHPQDGAVVYVARDRSVPAGKLAVIADRAAQAAKRWLEEREE